MTLSIRLKLIIFTFCIVLLVGGGIFVYSVYQGQNRILAAYRQEALETTGFVADTIVNDIYFLDLRGLRLRLQSVRANPDIKYTYVTDAEGVVLTDGTEENVLRGRRLTDPFSLEMLRSTTWISRIDGSLLKVGGPVLAPDGARIAYLQVGFSLDAPAHTGREAAKTSLYVTLISLGVGALLAFILATGFSRPILSIVRAAEQIGQGKLDTRVPVERSDELGTLARSVNRMAEALQRRQEENASLFEETKRNLEGIRALHEIDIAISSSLDLRHILRVLLDKIDLFLPYSTATVRLLNKGSGLLEPVACRNLDEAEWKVAAWKPGRGPANAVFESKAPLVIRNCLDDPHVRDPEFFRKHRLVSYLGVPMFAKEEILGVLSFYTREEHQFTNEEVEFLSTLAGQAAIAIHNSEVYEEMAKLASNLSRSNRVKDEFLSVMSHELRTPLNVVMGYTGMIKDRLLGEINPEQEKALEKVISRARDQLSMISSILQATQLEAEGVKVEAHEVNLEEFLDDLKLNYALASDKELNIVWDYPSDLPVINTDSEKLKHVLQNLINNAIKFTEKGEVRVSARAIQGNRQQAIGNREDSPEAQEVLTNASCLGPNASGCWVQFRVADSGIGIAKEYQAMIFERFRQVDSSETRNYGGVGIGLYIVKKFTELLGGKVEVESKPGKGSIFTVTVPRELPKV